MGLLGCFIFFLGGTTSLLLGSSAYAQVIEQPPSQLQPQMAVTASLIQSEWSTSHRVTAIGDIHGDFDALVKILIDEKLIDQKYRWTGGEQHLVLLGDLVSGQDRSKDVLDLVMSLEAQSKKKGGRVHAIMGNHDIIVASGHFQKMTKKDRLAFFGDMSEKQDSIKSNLAELFRRSGPYADWTAQRPLAVRINDQLFVHAGIDRRIESMSLSQINQIGRDWVLHLQGRGGTPDRSTSWIVGLKDGKFRRGERLLFSRDFKITEKVLKHADEVPRKGPKKKQLKEVLAQFGARQMVIGHVPTPDAKIKLKHPYYRDLVVSVDTQISDEKSGRLSALEIIDGKLAKKYFERSSVKQPAINACRAVYLN